MVSLVVNFNAARLPSRAQWERVAEERRVPVRFAPEFEPATHPRCAPSQVDHPGGCIAVRVGDATCHCQLDLYDSSEVEGCDRSAAFRWSEFSLPDALGAQLAAATLAAATDGVVSWQRAKGGWCRGTQAFDVITRQAYRDVGKVLGSGFSRANPFGPPVDVAPLETGWLECPRCGRRFDPRSERSWDGEKHLGCGQLIRVAGRI